jgi:hypothetical protein
MVALMAESAFSGSLSQAVSFELVRETGISCWEDVSRFDLVYKDIL